MTLLSGIANMAGLNDQIITTDFVISLKSTIQNYCVAITEVTSAELRTTLKNQLNAAIDTHEKISDYMMNKGFYHAYDKEEQKNEILEISRLALELYKSKN